MHLFSGGGHEAAVEMLGGARCLAQHRCNQASGANSAVTTLSVFCLVEGLDGLFDQRLIDLNVIQFVGG